MNRRSIWILAVSSLCGHAWAQENPLAARIEILEDLVKAIGSAGDAISKLTAGVRDLVVNGSNAYDYVAASREHDHLVALSNQLSSLVATQQTNVVSNIEDYLSTMSSEATRKKTDVQQSWELVVSRLRSVLESTKNLLDEVDHEKSDFVLQPAFLKLKEALAVKFSIMDKLMSMPAPSSPEELSKLKAADYQYKRLISNTRDAIAALNSYASSRAGVAASAAH